MLKNSQSNSLTQILELLKDGQWHSSDEIANQVSFRFGHLIYQARKNGYEIETNRNNNQYQYRWKSPSQEIIDQTNSLTSLQSRIPHLDLLILFGSRARGDYQLDSDWDFAVLYNQEFYENCVSGYMNLEIYDILSEFYQISHTKIDVVNLNYCSDLIAHQVAHDGQLIYESQSGLFNEFVQKYLMTSEQLQSLQTAMTNKLESYLNHRGL